MVHLHNKKGAMEGKPVEYILIILGVTLMIVFVISFIPSVSEAGAHKICEWSVKAKEETKVPLLTNFFGKSAISEVCRFDPITLDKGDNVRMELAHAVAQCWEDFGAGEVDPDSGLFGKNACYVCQPVVIKEIEEPLSVKDFKDYLYATEVPSKYFNKRGYSYWDYLQRSDLPDSEDNKYYFSIDFIDQFEANKKYAIIFINDQDSSAFSIVAKRVVQGATGGAVIMGGGLGILSGSVAIIPGGILGGFLGGVGGFLEGVPEGIIREFTDPEQYAISVVPYKSEYLNCPWGDIK